MVEKALQKLSTIESSESTDRQRLNEIIAQGSLAEVDTRFFASQLKEIVSSSEFQKLIEEGKITFAMIKPRLHEAVPQGEEPKTDSEIEAQLLEEIAPPLQVLISFSFVMTREFIEEFYGGRPKQSQIEIPPLDSKRYNMEHANRWEEFVALMTSGATTGIILFDQNCHAVRAWRTQMGESWNVHTNKEQSPDSLRAKFGVDNHNNLLHGSESKKSVKDEIDLVVGLLASDI